MSEIRLYVSTTEPVAEQVLEALSSRFGEEDYAIATQEIDEARGIWEASIYGTADQEEPDLLNRQAEERDHREGLFYHPASYNDDPDPRFEDD